MIILGLLVYFLASLANGECGIFLMSCGLQNSFPDYFRGEMKWHKKKNQMFYELILRKVKTNIYERFQQS